MEAPEAAPAAGRKVLNSEITAIDDGVFCETFLLTIVTLQIFCRSF